ncbi:hypothetical protein ACG7TL_001086 [Trametes sanguinea]
MQQFPCGHVHLLTFTMQEVESSGDTVMTEPVVTFKADDCEQAKAWGKCLIPLLNTVISKLHGDHAGREERLSSSLETACRLVNEFHALFHISESKRNDVEEELIQFRRIFLARFSGISVSDPMDGWEIEEPRYDSARKRMRSDAEELQHPHLFLQNAAGHYKCMLCADQRYEPLSKAIQHEFTSKHTKRVREYDRPDQFSSPFHSALDEFPDNMNIGYDDSTANIPVPFHSDEHLEARPDPDDLVPDANPSALNPSPYDASTIHGPALPEDAPEQLYDNWGGELSISPQPADSSVDEDRSTEYSSDDEGWDEGPNGIASTSSPSANPGIEVMPSPDLGPSEDNLVKEQHYNTDSEARLLAPDLVSAIDDEGDLWWPWPDKATCLMDTTAAFPRALFSDSELRGAKRWAHEVDANLAAPMARSADGKDYFVNELAMANIDAFGYLAPVVPIRWFRRDGALFAKACLVRLDTSMQGTPTKFVVDAQESGEVDIPLSKFVLNVEDLCTPEVQERWALPPPDHISEPGIHGNTLRPWVHPVRNEWRVKAEGKPVYGLPLWLYCDDTSGNVSKKWNKHNSILFVLGGLPSELAQLLYNVQFLSTSNLASPLEMMEAVTNVLRDARTNGIEGDNPMASEFASHIGMKGKYMCRICHARGDHQNRPAGEAGEKERLTEFMTAGVPRRKEEALAELARQEARAFDGAPSAVDAMATETGIKDKYLQHFVEKLQVKLNKWREDDKQDGLPAAEGTPAQSTSSRSTRATRQAEFLQQLRRDMPDNLVNPPEIDNLPQYEGALTDAVTDFLAATALWNTQWFNKTKFHLFVHLLTHIRRFGPAIQFATETFESYNLVIRLRSVNSNKHAPSVDIARSFSHLHAIRHLAGAGVLSLVQDREFVDLMSMKSLFPVSHSGYYRPLDAKHPRTEASETLTASKLHIPSLQGMVTCCKSIVLHNNDRVSIGDYVAFVHAESPPGRPMLGRVDEIIVDSALGMPACRVKTHSYIFAKFQDVLGIISTIHNCAAHGCQPSRTKIVVQERMETRDREDEVRHSKEPEDRMVNLAQLRNVRLRSRLTRAVRYPEYTFADVLDRAIANKKAMEMAAEERRQALATKKAQRARPAAQSQKSNQRKQQTPHLATATLPPPSRSATPVALSHIARGSGFSSGETALQRAATPLWIPPAYHGCMPNPLLSGVLVNLDGDQPRRDHMILPQDMHHGAPFPINGHPLQPPLVQSATQNIMDTARRFLKAQLIQFIVQAFHPITLIDQTRVSTTLTHPSDYLQVTIRRDRYDKPDHGATY